MILKHARLAIELKGEYTAIREMRKHVGWYVGGIPHAAAIRNSVNFIESYEALEEMVEKYFLTIRS